MASSYGEAGAGQEEEEEDGERSLAPPDGVELQPQPSPQLSKRTLDELGQLQTSDADPDNYPLHSTWAFWFER